MIRTRSLYETCHELFTDYPLAVRVVNRSGTIRSMVLMLPDGDDADFFVLMCDSSQDGPLYSLCIWRAGGIVDIDADSSAAVPNVVVNAVTRGIPIPRHGTVSGGAAAMPSSHWSLFSRSPRPRPQSPLGR